MQIYALGGKPDPFYMPETDDPNNAWGRVSYRAPVVPQAIQAGENTAVWLSLGQSTTANHDQVGYSVASAKAQNFNAYDGAIYKADAPLLGCSGLSGNWNPRCADKMLAAGMFQRVIIVPIGVGGTVVSQWQPTGGSLWARVLAAKARLDGRGLMPTFITWMQGESDQTAGTSQSAYSASLADLISGLRGIGYNMPIFVSQTTYNGTTSYAPVRAAQAAAVNNPAGIYAGPDTDSLSDPSYRFGAHWSALGSDAVAGLWKSAIDAVF
ncbi:sialate O-acetylesterase [Bradyrhizobium ottawaense]|uniref:sialate O-acetylesterase n=1 Tax=Bradyrhizobium ottawaense TaxID=931866 RepID=UPI0027150324|nr:sialate O-acetylesterase [Bradyrhizobium ottawaense]WLB43008.1 sialate O-acetylesterase [Bradyrhizobium ottawaense]